ncbi:MAG: DNA methyltransferase [Chthoniobacterales bacterium]|nr:MAG: DNA methyltransferase [Chthoniobacterales bacterium]PZR73629.1 MAG: DNA methyltransferase [Chthoniobacterales bacterium]
MNVVNPTTLSEPFLKWAGGKRWLVRGYSHLFPMEFERYIEPFLGSGAVFFHLLPLQSILADKNAELIAAYRVIRRYPDEVAKLLESYHGRHSCRFYYDIRDADLESEIEQAARFVYLNRVCWNGLYRVNLKGKFNVPIGTKTQVKFQTGFLRQVSTHLKHAKLMTSDFETVIDGARCNDFVYVDPPYTVSHNNNGFIKYNGVLFSWADQLRLANAVKRAVARGALVFVSNADHAPVKKLYRELPFYRKLGRASILAGDSGARRQTSEAAFLSYQPTLEDEL